MGAGTMMRNMRLGLAILAAVDFVKTHFGIEMECTEVHCTHYAQNNQCIGKRCPFWRFDDNI